MKTLEHFHLQLAKISFLSLNVAQPTLVNQGGMHYSSENFTERHTTYFVEDDLNSRQSIRR